MSDEVKNKGTLGSPTVLESKKLGKCTMFVIGARNNGEKTLWHELSKMSGITADPSSGGNILIKAEGGSVSSVATIISKISKLKEVEEITILPSAMNNPYIGKEEMIEQVKSGGGGLGCVVLPSL